MLPLLPLVVHPGSAIALDPPRARAITRVAAWPVIPAVVVATFDPPAVRWATGHRGVDLATSHGAVVRAAASGTVTFAGDLAGRGVVVVSHGALRTTYEPVEASVTVGAAVVAGSPIGVVGTGATHCGDASCVHWGLLRGDRYLDPRLLLGIRPVLKRV